MNTDQKLILRYLSARGMWYPTTTFTVAVGCAIGYEDAERELLALDVLGLAEFSGAGWELTDEGRNHVLTRMAHE